MESEMNEAKEYFNEMLVQCLKTTAEADNSEEQYRINKKFKDWTHDFIDSLENKGLNRRECIRNLVTSENKSWEEYTPLTSYMNMSSHSVDNHPEGERNHVDYVSSVSRHILKSLGEKN